METFSISYGYVAQEEAKDLSVLEIAEAADKRMYEAKTNYYREQGLERRRT